MTKLLPLLILSLTLLTSCSRANENTPSGQEYPVDAVETYNYSPSVNGSKKYLVFVNGVRQGTFDTGEGQICTFGCEGKVQVKVYLTGTIESVALRPTNKNYTYVQMDESCICFEVEPYDRLSIEFNGSHEKPLLLFANPKTKTVYSGKGTKCYPAGQIHTSGTIMLKSNDTLYVEGGAVLNAIVKAENAEDVTICGFGIIDARENSSDANGIRLASCKGVDVSGIIILNDDGRVMFNYDNDGLAIDNVKAIGNIEGGQTDVFDLYSDRNCTIKRCFAMGNDDTYCIKSWKYAYKGESYNISFEDCIAWNYRGNGFEIGYETGIDIHDIQYKDIFSIHSSEGGSSLLRRGAVSIHNAAAGTISNVTYENVYIEDPYEGGIDMRVLKSAYDLGTGETWGPGITKGVKMKNVHIDRMPPEGNFVLGYDKDHTVDLDIEGLYIAGVKTDNASDAKFKKSFCNLTIK